MKALKNDCGKYMYEIYTAIENCYVDKEPSNKELMSLYAFIGESICSQGEKAFVVFLADSLEKQFPDYKGFSPRNLRRMRDYYRAYENDPDLLHKTEALGWTQNVVILESCDSNEQRGFYISLSLEQNLSKLALLKVIEAGIFEQTKCDEEEMRNTHYVAEIENDIPFDDSIGLTETNRTVCGPFMPMRLTSRQGNFMPPGRQVALIIAEMNVLRLWISSQRVCNTFFINLTRSFIRGKELLWRGRYRRRMAEKFTVADAIPDRNKVIWKPPKVHRNCLA